MARGNAAVPIIAAAAAIAASLLYVYFSSTCCDTGGSGGGGKDGDKSNGDTHQDAKSDGKEKMNVNLKSSSGGARSAAAVGDDGINEGEQHRSATPPPTTSTTSTTSTSAASAAASTETTQDNDNDNDDNDNSQSPNTALPKSQHDSSNSLNNKDDSKRSKNKQASSSKNNRLKKIHGMLKTTVDYLEQCGNSPMPPTPTTSGRKVVGELLGPVVIPLKVEVEVVDQLMAPLLDDDDDDDAENVTNALPAAAAAANDANEETNINAEIKSRRALKHSTTGEEAISEGENDDAVSIVPAIVVSEETMMADENNTTANDNEKDNASSAAAATTETDDVANDDDDVIDKGAKENVNDVDLKKRNVNRDVQEQRNAQQLFVDQLLMSKNEEAAASSAAATAAATATGEEEGDEEYVGDVTVATDSEPVSTDTTAADIDDDATKSTTDVAATNDETLPMQSQHQQQQQQQQKQHAISSSPNKQPPPQGNEVETKQGMEPPTDTEDYSLLKNYWKQQSDKHVFRAPIETAAAATTASFSGAGDGGAPVKSNVDTLTKANEGNVKEPQLQSQTQQSALPEAVDDAKDANEVDDPQLIVKKGSGSDGSSDNDEEGYVKIVRTPSGDAMTESELLTRPVDMELDVDADGKVTVDSSNAIMDDGAVEEVKEVKEIPSLDAIIGEEEEEMQTEKVAEAPSLVEADTPSPIVEEATGENDGGEDNDGGAAKKKTNANKKKKKKKKGGNKKK